MVVRLLLTFIVISNNSGTLQALDHPPSGFAILNLIDYTYLLGLIYQITQSKFRDTKTSL